MKFMSTERERQRSDTRTVRAFFAAMAITLAAFASVVGLQYGLFGS